MPDFHRTAINDDNFIRGAGRLMTAAVNASFPTTINDVINVSTYNAQTGWSDLGATKTGITISVNNTEETFDVDQIYGDIESRPTGWTCEVTTALAEVTLSHLALAWEGSTPVTFSGSGQTEKQMGIGNPLIYTKRRLAVLYQKDNGRIRAYIFRKVQRAAQDSSTVFSKSGEQQTVALHFRALADASISDQLQRYFMIFDQDTTNQ